MNEHMYTSEIRPVRQTSGHFSVASDDVDDALLDEVHLCANRSLFDDVVSGLKNLVLEFRDDIRHEVWICMSEERNGGNKGTTVVVDDLLLDKKKGTTTQE